MWKHLHKQAVTYTGFKSATSDKHKAGKREAAAFKIKDAVPCYQFLNLSQ